VITRADLDEVWTPSEAREPVDLGIEVASQPHMIKMAVGFIVTSLLATIACGGGEQPAKVPDSPQPSSTSTPDTSATSAPPAPSATPVAAAPVAASSADTTAQAQPLLSDEQILQVVHVANQGEIEQAKLAKSKGQDPRTKKLAAMMITDHSAADHKTMALAKKSGGPTPSSTSVSLQNDAQNATAILETQSGADFDKGYVDTQVKEHQAVLGIIDRQLVPNAKDADVKAFITEVRAKVAMHLQHAQDLQTAMAK
jgi:putative membrane protein